MAPNNNNQLLRLTIGHRAPTSVAMVATPPPDDEEEKYGEGLCLPSSHLEEQSREQTQQQTPECVDHSRRRDDPVGRIYRLTPIPTMLLDESLRVVEVSDSYLARSRARSQLSRDALLDRCVYELPPCVIPAPDTITLSSAVRAAVASRAVQTIDGVYVASTSSRHSLRLTPIFDGAALLYIVLEMQDIIIASEHAQPHDPPAAYVNETYRTLLDTVQDYAIFMLDTSGCIATWNAGAAVLKGYATDEIIGRHFSTFYSDEDCRAQKPAKELEVCLREGRVEDDGWRYRQDGSRFWANVLITPVRQFGHHVGFAKVTRDLTERKAGETRLIAAFEESSKLKSDFLANMSHEIRSPMNGMLLALTMLMTTGLDAQQREYACIIEDSTSILLQVINDVLDYSKLSSGAFSLHADDDALDVRAVIDAVVRNCKASLKPGVELTSHLADDFPRCVKGDPLRYRQVVQNLVGNAVKFTESGSIHIRTSFSSDHDDDNAKPDSYHTMTEVIDTGVGVPGDDAANTLFTPFTRFTNSSTTTTTQRYQGTGLGLSICKGLAELMDGTVGFRPNPAGRGSVFWMTAQVGRSTANRTTDGEKTHHHHHHHHQPGMLEAVDPLIEDIRQVAPQKHILVVEDNMVNQTVMRKLLQSVGFERVDTAWDGAQAVRMVQQRPLSYNVVLMDINMPVLSGLEATTQIRDMRVDVPIIALTGNALKGDAEMYLATGMDDYLAKPIHRQQLLRMLWKWIRS